MQIETWNKNRFLKLHASLRTTIGGFIWEKREAIALEMYRAVPPIVGGHEDWDGVRFGVPGQ